MNPDKMELPSWKKPTEATPLVRLAENIKKLAGPSKPVIPVGLEIYRKRYGKNGK